MIVVQDGQNRCDLLDHTNTADFLTHGLYAFVNHRDQGLWSGLSRSHKVNSDLFALQSDDMCLWLVIVRGILALTAIVIGQILSHRGDRHRL